MQNIAKNTVTDSVINVGCHENKPSTHNTITVHSIHINYLKLTANS